MTQSDLIQQWRKAGYKDRMGSCTILPPPGAGIVRAYTMVGSDFAEAKPRPRHQSSDGRKPVHIAREFLTNIWSRIGRARAPEECP